MCIASEVSYIFHSLCTWRGASSPTGTNVAKLQGWASSVLAMKWAAYCASCWGSFLLTFSICPSWYSFSTHWDATYVDVMPFKFPSRPSSCNIPCKSCQSRNRAIRIVTKTVHSYLEKGNCKLMEKKKNSQCTSYQHVPKRHIMLIIWCYKGVNSRRMVIMEYLGKSSQSRSSSLLVG